jgi:uridine kinase
MHRQVIEPTTHQPGVIIPHGGNGLALNATTKVASVIGQLKRLYRIARPLEDIDVPLDLPTVGSSKVSSSKP